MISMESFYSSLSAPQKIGPVGTQRYEQEEHLPEKEDKGQDSAILGYASQQDMGGVEGFEALGFAGRGYRQL